MRTHIWMLAIAAVVLAFPSTAQAQQVHERFWWGFGLGGGWSSWQWSFAEDGLRGGAGYVRLGGTVNQQVLFGGEAMVFWRDPDSGAEHHRVNATAVALLYASRSGGLFFKGGFGVAQAELPHGESEGVGGTFGAGIDLRIGHNAYITPNVDVMVQFFDNDTNASLLFTLGIIWH